MQLGHYHLEAFISAGLLVTAVVAALMCDLLKGKNEQLRELLAELKARNEEVERREQILLSRANQFAHLATDSDTSATPGISATGDNQPAAESLDASPDMGALSSETPKFAATSHKTRQHGRKNHRERKQTLSPDAIASIERGLQMATDPRLAAKLKKLAPKPEVWQKVAEPSFADHSFADAAGSSMADAFSPVAEHEFGTAPAASYPASFPAAAPVPASASTVLSTKSPRRSPISWPESIAPASSLAQMPVFSEAKPVPGPSATPVQQAPAQQMTEQTESVVVLSQSLISPSSHGTRQPAPLASAFVTVTEQASTSSQASQAHQDSKASKKNWSALLARQTAGTAAKNELLDAVVAATAAPENVQNQVPAGFHDGQVLSQLVRSNQPVSGLVVSIGTTGNIPGQLHSGVADLMRSLLGPADFGCQAGAEEFLLIFPGERGASAQRKLSTIAQQLWNFQLRAMGQFEILFSWGGMEVRSECVETAIASAKERMNETKRGRKLAAVENPSQPHVHAA